MLSNRLRLALQTAPANITRSGKSKLATLRVEENAMRCRFSLALSAVSSFVRV
jgi:hypothetical protein